MFLSTEIIFIWWNFSTSYFKYRKSFSNLNNWIYFFRQQPKVVYHQAKNMSEDKGILSEFKSIINIIEIF